PPPSRSRTNASSATVQQKSIGTSVVISRAEKATPGRVAYATADQMPSAGPSIRKPTAPTTAAVAPCSSGAANRTHGSPSPQSAVVATISHATIGGFDQ